jgi:hypothetical protein
MSEIRLETFIKISQTLQKSGGNLMKSFSFCLLVLVAFGLIFPSNAFACACCAEPGTYVLRTGKPESFELDILNEIKFDKDAGLYMTDAGFDLIKGLKEIEKDMESESWTASPFDFELTNSFAAKTWKFNFKTPTGKTGVLTLPMPAQMVQYKVDIHDGKTIGAGGPMLYKEWRFKGNVSSGTGIFKSSIVRPTTYFLVLQGRGNVCDSAENFTDWRLEINGKNADYAFIGSLSSGVDYTEDEQEETEK